ncbi:MAG: ligand-binding sensor domain-containing protein [Candidatus Azotimanducaceae bacterium]|jgi:ligand-binding sensor domain-containing protein
MMSRKVVSRSHIHLKRFAAATIVLVLVLVTFSGMSSATSKLSAASFRNFDDSDGLSNTAVLDIVRDSQGFVWVATQSGLNRFDGYEFKSYLHQEADENSIGNNHVSALMIAEDEKIWVGTDSGVYIFDSATDTFEPLGGMAGKPLSKVKAIFRDSSGSKWIASNSGLYRIDKNGRWSRLFDPFFRQQFYNKGARVISIFEDRFGTIWLGTNGHGVFYILNEALTYLELGDRGKGLHIRSFAFNEVDKTVIVSARYSGVFQFQHPRFGSASELDKIDLGISGSRALLELDDGRILIGTDEG